MHPLKFSKIWLTLGWLLIAVVIFLSLWPKPPRPLEFEQSDKLAHCIAYMVLVLWFANIYPQRPHHLRFLSGQDTPCDLPHQSRHPAGTNFRRIKNPEPKDPISGFQVSGVRCQVSGVRKEKQKN